MIIEMYDVLARGKTATELKRAKCVSHILLPRFIGTGDNDPRRVAFCDLLRVIARDYRDLVLSLILALESIPEQSVYPSYADTMRIWRRIGKDSIPPNDHFGRACVLVDGLRRVYENGDALRLFNLFLECLPGLTLEDLDLLLTDLFRVFYIQYTFTL